VDVRFAIAAAVIIAFALRVRSASSRQPAKTRLKPARPQRKPARSLAERLGSAVAELNVYLLVLVLGLGVLDLVGLAIVNLPDPSAAAAGNVADNAQAVAVDPPIAAAAAWRF
jgi:hypothetical protein